MRYSFLYCFVLISSILFGCQNSTPFMGDVDNGIITNAETVNGVVFYAPENYILGLQEETMLTTEFATLKIEFNDTAAVIQFTFKGLEMDPFSIGAFQIVVLDTPYERQSTTYSFNCKGVSGAVSYTMVTGYHNERTQGIIIRDFDICGSVDVADSSNSSISFTSLLLNKELTLCLQNITLEESDAEFGKIGYPCREIELMSDAKRLFNNYSGHDVTIRHESSANPYHELGLIQDGGSNNFDLFDSEDRLGAYILTFDDGKVSRHQQDGTTRPRVKCFEYVGLPVEVIEIPYLSFNYGVIYYELGYLCTYTITPEVYQSGDYQE